MKKLLTLFLALVATTALWASNTITYTATQKLSETTSYYSTGLHTDAFNVSISSHTFSNGTGIITFSGEIITIGNRGFYKCTNLSSIEVPNSVTTIGDEAFSGCSGLTSVTIPNSVTTIGDEAFYFCSGLTSIAIPNSVTTIGEKAFDGCSGLTSVTIPNSVTTIGEKAFDGCKIKSVTWNAKNCNGSYFDYSGTYPFFGNQVEMFTFGDKVEVIPSYICKGMNKLTSITIPNSVTTIGKYAFYNCTGLTSVIIGNSVTTIGEDAFRGCSGLTSITIPNSVTTIEFGAFSGCSGLTSITIPNSVTKIGSSAFDGCKIKSVTWNAKNCISSYNFGNQVESFAFGESVEVIPTRLCENMSKLTSITIPNSVTTIGNYAFSGCSGLTSVTIPNSVTTIGDYAFCNINNIVYSGTATGSPWKAKCVNGYVDGNMVYSDASRITLCGCSSIATGEITIPNSVTSIGESAFYNCSGLTSIVIPNSVVTIGEDAFYECTGLTSVTIPNSVTTIGNYAFSSCSGLTSVTIPNSVTTIGNFAFTNCSGLTSVTIPNSVTTIGNYAFYNCTGLTSVIIGNSVTTIGGSAFFYCTSLKTVCNNSDLNIIKGSTENGYVAYYANKVYKNGILVGDFVIRDDTIVIGYIGNKAEVTIPDNITIIGNSAFKDSDRLTSITIPNSVTTIGDEAFSDCSGLTSVTIPNSVTTIGNYAFNNCTGLTSVTIPNSVTTIGDDAFQGCSGLTSIIIPNSITKIGYAAFQKCTMLTSITIPNSVTTIGNYAFYYCTMLTSITIPNSVTSIGEMAFYNCTSLKTVCNNSDLNITKGSTANGYVAYYADKVYNGILVGDFIIKQDTLLTAYIGKDGYVTIPNEITAIGASAFANCSTLTSIAIPNSVTTIGESAFRGCSGLTSITIPNSVTKIGSSAFDGCKIKSVTWNAKNCNGWNFGSQVKTFVLGDSVEVIPDNLCKGMNKLTTITIPNSVTTIGDEAFYFCSGLTSITIPNSVTTIGNYAFINCTGLTSVTIGNSVTTIGNYAFCGCGLTSVIIPNSVTTIGNYAFYGCSGLTSITVASDNPKYDSRGNCNAIIEIATNKLIQGCKNTTIPNSVTSIGERAFRGCKGLTSITIPNSVTTIGEDAFHECTGLTSITIGNSVTTIGNNAFFWCKGLTSITIPNSVTTVGNYAFYDCSGLTSITSYAINPPTCGTDCFENVDKSIPIYVPVRSVDHYKQVEGWKEFANIQGNPNDYSIVSGLAENGTIFGDGKYIKGDTCTLTATANYGYHFTQWNDGNTDNPRKIIVTQDTTLTAEFSKNIYTISIYAEHGSVAGGGEYEYLSSVKLTATADEHYHFTQWSDGNTDNPRTITIEEDKTYTAIFSIDQHTISAYAEHGIVSGLGTYNYGTNVTLTVIPDLGYEFASWSDSSTDNPRTVFVTGDVTYNCICTQMTAGKCGDNLYWEYKEGKLIITGMGEMYDYAINEMPWYLYRDNIQYVEFSADLTYIGCYAFANFIHIEEITCFANQSPRVCSTTFDGLSKQYIYLYVPADYVRSYQVNPSWNEFDIRAIDETGWQDVRSGINATKYFHNGNLIIERNGVKYTPTGQKVR